MSLINTLSYAEAAGFLKGAYASLSGAEAVRFFTTYPYARTMMNVNFSGPAIIEGLDTLTPLPIKLAGANVNNVVEMRKGFTISGFNPLSTLTTQGGGQIWGDMITPAEVKQREEMTQIDQLERQQKALKNSPLRTSAVRASMSERRRLLEEKRNAYRQEELRLAREEREKRLGVVKKKRKFPATAKKRLERENHSRFITEQNTNDHATRSVWRRKGQKGF